MIQAPGDKRGLLELRATAVQIGFVPRKMWCAVPDANHSTAPKSVPGIIRIGTWNTPEAQASFSPSPFAVVVERGERRALLTVAAPAGWHRFNYVRFEVSREGVVALVDLEGRTAPGVARQHIGLYVTEGQAGESRHQLMTRGLRDLYPGTDRGPSVQPAWWHRPIYCGWGDQVAMSLHLEGPGPEYRSLPYCTQGLYRRWVRRLEAARVPIGTVIIDAGWSPGGVWRPHRALWPDLRAFIAEEHAAGRKVLLWIGTWLHEGLPDEWCIRSGKERLTANPLPPEDRKFLRAQVRELLSPDGFDADGFKIDQLGWLPSSAFTFNAEHFGRTDVVSRSKIAWQQEMWGCELLYDLQKQIYDAAKSVKPDSLITSSTVHPYFHDTFDMVRLHDTGKPRGGVLEPMRARADVARAALPGHPVDTDDWIPYYYRKWLEYTLCSHQIGTPCLFYSEWFVKSFEQDPTVLPIRRRDLERIGQVWRGYLERLNQGTETVPGDVAAATAATTPEVEASAT